jgi:hypothetical protein
VKSVVSYYFKEFIMSSEKQIEANRQNAQKSTGPKTPEGKAKVSQNAVTHGLTAESPVLCTENPQQYDLFHENLTRQLAPEGVLEYFLAERAANLSWRLNRAQRYDALILDQINNDAQPSGNSDNSQIENLSSSLSKDRKSSIENDQSLFGRVLTDDFQNRRTLEKIQRYEFRIERGFYRALRELYKLQFHRLNSVGEASSLRNKVAESAAADSFGFSSDNSKTNPNNLCGDNLSNNPVQPRSIEPDCVRQNKANFPLDIITQIENKRLRSRLLDKKAV